MGSFSLSLFSTEQLCLSLSPSTREGPIDVCRLRDNLFTVLQQLYWRLMCRISVAKAQGIGHLSARLMSRCEGILPPTLAMTDNDPISK